MHPKLVTFGNVLLDFTYCVKKTPGIYSKFNFDSNGLGECSSEILSNVRKYADETCEFLSAQSGGSALNTSKILSLPSETDLVFCGAIGNDANGNAIKQQLDKCHLKSCLQLVKEEATGTCMCLINKMDRCCYGNIGASIHFQQAFFLSQDLISSHSMQSSLASNQIFYIEGFFITGNRFSVCKYIIDEVCQTRTFAANLSAEYLIANNPQQMKYLAEHAAILFGNRREFDKLAQIYEMSNARNVIAHLINKSETADKIIICTQGGENVLYSSRSQMIVNNEYAIAQPTMKIIDTTGCGDAFVAGFFYAHLRNESISNCVAKGAEVALKKMTSVGGTLSP